MSDLIPQTPEDYTRHFARKTRRAMRAMAESLGIDHEKFPDPQDLWVQISERIAGGIPRANAAVIGDPFALFVTFRCHNHRETWEQTLVAKARDTQPIDEEEGKRIIAQFMGSDRSACEMCGSKLTEYSAQMTRMSVFVEQQNQVKPTLLKQAIDRT